MDLQMSLFHSLPNEWSCIKRKPPYLKHTYIKNKYNVLLLFLGFLHLHAWYFPFVYRVALSLSHTCTQKQTHFYWPECRAWQLSSDCCAAQLQPACKYPGWWKNLLRDGESERDRFKYNTEGGKKKCTYSTAYIHTHSWTHRNVLSKRPRSTEREEPE